MSVSRILRAVAGVAVVAVSVVGFGSQALAGSEPEAEAFAYCSDVSNIRFGLYGSLGTDTFTLFIDDMISPADSEAGVGEITLPAGDGEVHHVKVVHQQSGDVLLDTDVAVACLAPFALFDTSCEEDGAHILVLLADYTKSAIWTVYVDVEVPVPGFNGVDDTDSQYADLGVFAEGPHQVLADALEGGDFIFEVDLECDDDGSGAGLPDAGSNTTPLTVAAGLFVLVGACLVLARRTRTA